MRIGFLVSGLSNWRDGGTLNSLLVNKCLGRMDTFVVIITRKVSPCYFRLTVAQYWIDPDRLPQYSSGRQRKKKSVEGMTTPEKS